MSRSAEYWDQYMEAYEDALRTRARSRPRGTSSGGPQVVHPAAGGVYYLPNPQKARSGVSEARRVHHGGTLGGQADVGIRGRWSVEGKREQMASGLVYDVAIIGGGIVGLATAMSMAGAMVFDWS